jgi:VWFA-related protein
MCLIGHLECTSIKQTVWVPIRKLLQKSEDGFEMFDRKDVCRLVLCSYFATDLAQTGQSAIGSTFQSKVDVVLVPVVVRDSHGNSIGNLIQGDFLLLDKGKRQTTASFEAIRRGVAGVSKPGDFIPSDVEKSQPGATGTENNAGRHLIYLFDDLNIRFADMAIVRAAAVRHFQNGAPGADQAAIYTFSGRQMLDFTRDRQKLEDTVSKIRWRPEAGHGGMSCPDVNYYLADLIIVKRDAQAFQGLVNHTIECARVLPEVAEVIATAAANQELILGAQDTQVALRSLRRAIRRLSGMPGQRILVLASPGFFSQTDVGIKATAEVLDLAAQSNVIISGLSVRGVILAEEEEDVAGRRRGAPQQLWMRYRREGARANGDVLKELAEGTGGIFFHNNNDLLKGLETAGTAPEFSYVLGFSPSALKHDGSFHSIKVRLTNGSTARVEARQGYYAIKEDSKDKNAAADVDDAVFSRSQVNDIPVVLQTGYSKRNDSEDAKVLVVTKIDIKSLHFRQGSGRNQDSLIVVSAVFDSEGGYVAGTKNTVNLRLKDESLAKSDPDVTLRSEFDVKLGEYVVRLVVREAEGTAMTTLNRTVTVH